MTNNKGNEMTIEEIKAEYTELLTVYMETEDWDEKDRLSPILEKLEKEYDNLLTNQ